jgi:hypothetical protein
LRRVALAERRARLAIRHRLAPGERAPDPVEAARAVVALHASDPPSVYLAARARTEEGSVADVEHALYEERMLVRLTGMRNTLFVAPSDLVPVIAAACLRTIAPRERRRLERLVQSADIAPEAAAWIERVERDVLAALARRGEAAGAELSREVPALREPLRFGEGTRWETTTAVTGRLLSVLAAEGRVVRGRPRGSWVSGQYRWAPAEAWLDAEVVELRAEAAEAELARRWLGAFGPGTAEDLRWWTGWTVKTTRRALAANAAVEVELDGGEVGCLLPDDAEPARAPEPWAALLPALDPTVMGWLERRWYLGEHGAALFDRNGNAGPTVWWDGRVVGGWGQRPGGEVVFRLLEDVEAEATAAIEAEAARLTAWFGGTRVTPRFRTPLERELAA